MSTKPLRVREKYASKLQKAEHESAKWKSQSEMLMSMISGQYRTIRRLTEQAMGILPICEYKTFINAQNDKRNTKPR